MKRFFLQRGDENVELELVAESVDEKTLDIYLREIAYHAREYCKIVGKERK